MGVLHVFLNWGYLFVLRLVFMYFVFFEYFLLAELIVFAAAINCLERLVSRMTCNFGLEEGEYCSMLYLYCICSMRAMWRLDASESRRKNSSWLH